MLDFFCQQNFIIKKIGQFYRWSCYLWQLYKIWYLNDAKMLIRNKWNIIFYFIKIFKIFNKILLDIFCLQIFIIKSIRQFYRWICYMCQLYKIWYLNDSNMLIRNKWNMIFLGKFIFKKSHMKRNCDLYFNIVDKKWRDAYFSLKWKEINWER